MSTNEKEVSSRQRGEAYWFLSNLFADQLDLEAVTQMASAANKSSTDFGQAGEIFRAFLDMRDLEILTLRLAQEHTRLFCGISEEYGPPPPYESLWREGVMMGESTVQVAQHYVQAGYRPDSRFAPLDHLVEELRFMASLCNAEHEAQVAGNDEAAGQLRHKQQRFLTDHLGVWIGNYCRKIAELSTEALYRSIARVTATVVAEDAAELVEMAQ